jgi:LemA protein
MDLTSALVIPGVALLVVVVWIVIAFNTLVRLRNHCDESWSDIDTELRRRYDLIPNIVSAVQAYATHERTVFEHVAAARGAALHSDGSPASQARDENAMVQSMRQLLAVAEAYPDLKASRHYLELQRELANTEERIQRARRFYNANVRDLNTRIEIVPSSLVAQRFGFARREYFEVDPIVREVPQVNERRVEK